MPDFQKLNEHSKRLSGFLDDPHPRLVTWCKAVAREWESIATMWNGVEQSDPADLNHGG